MAREHPGEQAGGGTGIAHVQHVLRLGQAAHAAAGHAPDAARMLHVRPQGTHGGGGAQHVLALQQALDARLADRQRAEHQGAVADGFIAGHPDAALQRGGRAVGGEGAGGGHDAARLAVARPFG